MSHVIAILNAYFGKHVFACKYEHRRKYRFFEKQKKWKIGRDRPEVAGMVGNRFAITLVGNLTPFYNFIMFLTYFLKNLFKKKVVCFFSKQHGIKRIFVGSDIPKISSV